MICTQCEGEIPQGATECPHCGATVGRGDAADDRHDRPKPSPTADGRAGVPRCPGAGASRDARRRPPPFKFDAKRWSQADRIAGGATLVLLISLFLPWFSVRFGASSDGPTR